MLCSEEESLATVVLGCGALMWKGMGGDGLSWVWVGSVWKKVLGSRIGDKERPALRPIFFTLDKEELLLLGAWTWTTNPSLSVWELEHELQIHLYLSPSQSLYIFYYWTFNLPQNLMLDKEGILLLKAGKRTANLSVYIYLTLSISVRLSPHIFPYASFLHDSWTPT